MGRSWFLIFSFCLSCANPNYVSTSLVGAGGGGADGGPGQKTTLCEAKFATQNCVSLSWEKMPTESAVGSFVFKTFRSNLADGSPVLENLPGDEVAVALWMPGMGHGSSPVKVERVDVGTYRASQVFFTMKGQWEIRIQLKERGDVKDQAILPITL